MNIRVIYNPAAGSADRLHEIHSALEGMTLVPAHSGAQTQQKTLEAWDEGAQIIVAAGGDGTVHHVVNGLMSREQRAGVADRPILGILPLGTGNDLARTLAIDTDDLFQAIICLRHPPQVRTLDLIRMRTRDMPMRWGINVAAGGFTGQVNEAMSGDMKKTSGPLAYLRGAIKVLPDVTDYRTTIRYDGSASQTVRALNVIVASCRTAGGGIYVAPLANPEDGLLDVVIVNSGSALELTAVAAKLLTSGNYLDARIVTHRRAKRVAIESTPGMWFNIDGELIGNEPVTFSVQPRALRVIVGPGYRADPPLAV